MLDIFRTGAKSFGVMLIFGIIIVVFVFWGVGNFNAPSSRTLAEVNGVPVTIEDFRPAYAQTMAEAVKEDPGLFSNAEKVKQYKLAVLQDLVKLKVMLQAAEKIGIVVTPQEIRKSIDSIQAFHNKEGKFDKEIFQAVLESQRLSQDVLFDDIAHNIMERKLLYYIQLSAGVNEAEEKGNYEFALERRKAQYVLFKAEDYLDKIELSEDDLRKDYEARQESFRTPQVVSIDYVPLTPETLGPTYPVSDTEAEEYYNKNLESFRKPERVLLRHIFVSFPIAGEHGRPLNREEQVKGAREIMDKALADLADGKDFAEVASLYSQDPQAVQNGGLLDWIQRGDLPIKEFEEAAFSLKKGETSEVIVSDQGLHLLRAEDREDGGLSSFAQSKEGIVKLLGMEKADADFTEVQKQAEDGLALGSTLAELAEKLKVAVQHTGMIPEADAEKALSLKDDSRQLLRDAIAAALADGKPKTDAQANATAAVAHGPRQTARTLPVPLNIENGIALVRINEATPSFIKPFEEVRDSIKERLTIEKAHTMARQEAEKALPAFTGKEVPEAYKDKAELSKEGARAFPILEPFGTAQQLIEGLFSSDGEWLPMVYDTKLGPVIARCASVEKATDAEWDKWKGIFMPQRLEYRRNQVLQAFMDGLDENLSFTVNTSLLDALPADFR